MNAYKVEAVVAENGTVILKGLPFQVGDTVEVIVLEQRSSPQQVLSERDRIAADQDYLRGVEAPMSDWVSARPLPVIPVETGIHSRAVTG